MLDDIRGFRVEGGAVGGAQSDPALEVGDHDVGGVDTVKLVYGVDPARREYVELQDSVADDIDGHEVEAVGQQLGAQDVADPRLDRAEVTLSAHRGAALGGAVGAGDGATSV